MMTPEELLKTRFQVIEDYPSSPYGIGDILEEHEPDKFYYSNCGVQYASAQTLRKYPKLFKELHWANVRKVEDMPRFLKDAKGETFIVVEYNEGLYAAYLLASFSSVVWGAKLPSRKGWQFTLHGLFPATEEDMRKTMAANTDLYDPELADQYIAKALKK